ncbi:type I restriction endonuclease, partial [Pseudophaeobacter sp.]|uniref:type I restriction endonuclease n=1 Tax=Pseudophaeobacter sp. TaxID=1971739 RepID=UPI00262D2CC1
MTNQTPDTNEEAAAKLPALHVLMVMGWEYLSPVDCLALRGSERSVVLETVLRERLAEHRFDYKGQRLPLSQSGVDQVIRDITSTGLSEGLLAANRAIFQHLTQGITVREVVDGKQHYVTVPLVNWQDVSNNRFQVTEELSVARTDGNRNFRPDIVCYVNGLPLVVIEAKRPVSSTKTTAMVDEGISQHLRNQKGDGIQDLYAYSQLLLSISGVEGRYGTTETPKKFWSKWREEKIAEAEVSAIKSTPLCASQRQALFSSRPSQAQASFDALHSGYVLPTEQDWLIISLLRPDRLLEFVRLFILYDRKVGKIAARYQQVFGIKALLDRVSHTRPDGGREGGVIWHTTGSGKSNLMVFLCKALLLNPNLADCRVIVVT